MHLTKLETKQQLKSKLLDIRYKAVKIKAETIEKGKENIKTRRYFLENINKIEKQYYSGKKKKTKVIRMKQDLTTDPTIIK